MNRLLARLPLLLLVLLLAAVPAHAFRVVTWNLLAYDDVAAHARRGAVLTVLPTLDPDVIILQELITNTAADSFATFLRTAIPGKNWAGGTATFIAGTQSALFYDANKFAHSNLTSVTTGGPRQALVALLRPNGYRANAASFRLYSIHFKAGNGAGGTSPPSDSATRTLECTNLRNTLNAAPAGTNMLLGGDTNFYGSFETGYTRLTESQADNDGRLRDPLTMTGLWNNPAYAGLLTQSPCAGAGCVGSSGGLDDRFDMILGTYSLHDGLGLDLIDSGYSAFGNDGNHYNDSVDGGGFNTVVPLGVATGLRLAADHLPVVATLQLPAKLATVSEITFGDVLLGATAAQTIDIDDLPAPPAATLSYSFSAPAGFTAPAGSFTNAANQLPAQHTLTMNTASVGARTGTLTVNSNDLDTTAKAVLLSGRVLAHAVPSLDSLTTTSATSAGFGTVAQDSNSELALRVFNRGYQALQARLAHTGAFIAGDTHFGFSAPSGLVTDATTYTLTFNASGVAPGITVTGELRIPVADEALPGAQAYDTLRVALSATVAASGGVDDAPLTLRFAPPAPNPLRHNTLFTYDLPRAAAASLTIHDVSGRTVTTLANGEHGAGRYQVRWNARRDDGSALPAGLYFARFATEGLTRTARLVVLP